MTISDRKSHWFPRLLIVLLVLSFACYIIALIDLIINFVSAIQVEENVKHIVEALKRL